MNAVSTLRKTGAQFAIRGGGHSPVPTWANIEGGVLLSLSEMTELCYEAETETIRIGAGVRWGQVYEYLNSFNRVIVSARAPYPGFGLLTGGGLSHLSNQHGFVGENIVEYEVVLANATKVVATSSFNSELFWALKGGGNNYGIITSAVFRTYPMGKVWGGIILYDGDQQDNIMRAFAEYQSTGQLDRKSALMSYVGVNNKTIVLVLAYLDEVERPAAFNAFYNITSLQDTTGTKNSFTELVNAPESPGPLRYSSTGTTVFLNATAYVDIANIAKKISTALEKVNGGTMLLIPQTISKSMIAESVAKGGSPMTAGLKNREQIWLGILVGWNLESDDAKVANILAETRHAIETYTKSKGLYDSFLFLSDAHPTEDPLRGYGMNTLRRLRRIGREYDPEGFFQAQMPGGFKLGTSPY